MFEQLKKPANIYFIIIMCMQCIDVISISDGKPAMLPPLIIVILASMIKDGYEDYRRHLKDDEENNSLCIFVNQ